MKENQEVVIPRLRPLRYPGPYEDDQTPVEKGIDVQMALGAVEQVLTRTCDVAVSFTHDTDLLPAVETICRLAGASHVETASWASHHFTRRLRQLPGVYHHYISGAVFQLVETPINYAYKGQTP